MDPQHLSERKRLYYFLRKFSQMKAELKYEIQIAKELLEPSPEVERLIRKQEALLEKVTKRVWELQMRSELLALKGCL